MKNFNGLFIEEFNNYEEIQSTKIFWKWLIKDINGNYQEDNYFYDENGYWPDGSKYPRWDEVTKQKIVTKWIEIDKDGDLVNSYFGE